VHGSIKSAIPENPLLGANICGLSVIQGDLQAILAQILGSQFWALGGLNQKSKKKFCRVSHGEMMANNGSIALRNKKEESI